MLIKEYKTNCQKLQDYEATRSSVQPGKHIKSDDLVSFQDSRLKRALVAVWCGENHWRAKRWTFWLITRPAPNANFQIITVFSMAAVAAGYSVH